MAKYDQSRINETADPYTSGTGGIEPLCDQFGRAVLAPGSGGGGGGDASAANQLIANAALGTPADTSSDTTIIGRLQNLLSRIPSALVGGRLDTILGSWLGSTAPTVGQKTMANSIPVALANDTLLDPTFGLARTASFGGTATQEPTVIIGYRSSFASIAATNDLSSHLTATADIAELTGSETLEVLSTNAADAAAGTGVRTLKITYINALDSNKEATTTVTMNGVSAVSLGAVRASFIQKVEAATVGSNDKAVGTISLRINGSGTVLATIAANENQAFLGQYMVPAGFYALCTDWNATARAQDMRVQLLASMLDSGVLTTHYLTHSMIDATATGGTNAQPMPFHKFPSGCRLKLAAVPGALTGTPRCTANMTVLILPN